MKPATQTYGELPNSNNQNTHVDVVRTHKVKSQGKPWSGIHKDSESEENQRSPDVTN